MRITDVRVVVHERQLGFVGTAPLPAVDTMPIGVLRVLTDEGIEGNVFVGGPVPAPVQARQIIEVLKPMLVGRDPLDIGAIWGAMWKRRNLVSPMAIGAVDVALWDIAGKAAGLPVHRLLGTVHDRLPAYVSSWVHRSSEAYADEAEWTRAQGFHGYKLHPPTQLRMFGLDTVENDRRRPRCVFRGT